MSEVWKDIPNYEGSYQVSNTGLVRSVDRVVTFKDGKVRKYKGRVLKPSLDTPGYERLSLCNDRRCSSKSVHRLVLEAFKPHVNMNNLEVNHIDGNKLNNHLTNLEWVTRLGNISHAYDMGLMVNKGERGHNAKLSNANVLEILERLDNGELQRDIGIDYGVSKSCISQINRGVKWRAVKEKYERAKKTIPK